MIVECPNCKSTFKVDAFKVKESYSKYKCSVCLHFWETSTDKSLNKVDKKKNPENSYKYVLLLNMLVILLVIIGLVFFKEKLVYLDSFWTEFYNFFLNLVPIK